MNERPNFVWLISEDNSKHFLKLFDEHGADTPNIAELAKQGLVYRHAFSNGAVCSVARSTLVSCCYAPRIGSHHHRRSKLVPMPDGLKMFPAYLRDAGYFTTNQSKKDYNIIEGSGVWDESSRKANWRSAKRKTGQPFFHKQSFGATHESSLHFNRRQLETRPTKADLSSIFVPPIHPPTKLFRYTYARYHDQIQKVDSQIGKVIDDLKADGLLDTTFVFYFGDHGGVLPGSKGYVYETGLHVPLVVRIPEKFKGLISQHAGTSRNEFVSFVDFGPTLMNLAGIAVPEKYDGRPFLGPGCSDEELENRNETIGYADRFDEKYDMVRTLRVGKWKYVRSYQPFNFDGLQNNYRYKMLAYQQWRNMFQAGNLNEVQSRFFQRRPAEMLFDVEADPYETNDLSELLIHRPRLLEFRRKLSEKLKSWPDLGFIPESHLYQEVFDENPVAYGESQKKQIAELIEIADLQVFSFYQARDLLVEAVRSKSRWQRYWGLITASSHAPTIDSDQFLMSLIVAASADADLLVRVRALECLALCQFDREKAKKFGAPDQQAISRQLIDCLNATQSPIEAALFLNTIVMLKDGTVGMKFDSSRLKVSKALSQYKDVQRRLEYLGWDNAGTP